MVTRITRDEINALPDMLTNESFVALFGTIPGSTDNKRLTLQCTKCSFPSKSIAALEATIATFKRYQAGPVETGGEFRITFNETTDFVVYSKFKTWMEMCHGTNNGVSAGYTDSYSITLPITIFDSTGKEVVVGTYYKVFPKSLPEISLDSSGSGEVVSIDVTFSYDYFVDSQGVTL